MNESKFNPVGALAKTEQVKENLTMSDRLSGIKSFASDISSNMIVMYAASVLKLLSIPILEIFYIKYITDKYSSDRQDVLNVFGILAAATTLMSGVLVPEAPIAILIVGAVLTLIYVLQIVFRVGQWFLGLVEQDVEEKLKQKKQLK